MTLHELLPTVSALPHAEKLQLMRWLVDEVNKEEGVSPLSPIEEFPIWSPHSDYEAAATLQEFLGGMRRQRP